MNFGLFPLAAGTVVLAAGVAVLLRERASREALLFMGCTLTVAFWLLGFGFMYGAPDEEAALHWAHVAYLGVPFIPVVTYHFTTAIVRVEERRRWVILAGWGAAVVVAGLSLGTDLVIIRMERYVWGWYTIAGPLGPIVLVLYVVMSGLALFEYVRALLRPLSPTERSRIQLLTGGFLVAYIGMVDFLPSYGVDVVPIGFVPVLLFLVVAGTAVWRYRLVDLTASYAASEILHTIADPLLVLDAEGRIRVANEAARRVFGWSEGELVGREVDVLSGGGQNGERLRAMLRRPRVEGEEIRLRDSGGDPVPVSLSTSPLGTPEGESPGQVVLLRDIREWKEAARRLEESEERYRSLFLYNPDGVFGIDPEGRFLTLNPASEELTGYPPGDLLGVSFAEIMSRESVEEASEIFQRVLEGEPEEWELSIRHREGRLVLLRGVSVPVIVGGEVVGVFGMARDITEERKAEEEVRREREYFRALFDTSPDAIAILDQDDRVVRVNAEFERMYGWSEEEARDRRINELIVPDGRRDEGTRISDRVMAGEDVAEESVRVRRDGTPLEVSIRGRPIRIEGEPLQIYGIYRDITRRKEAERELREKEEQLRHAQRLESVGRLAGGVAHDFNNILTVITGHARMMVDGLPEGHEYREDALAVHRAAERAATLTQQLLAFSRRQMVQPRPVGLNDVIHDTEKMLRTLLGERVRLDLRLDEEVWTVLADPAQLEQVIVNLAVNARDAMPAGGTFTIETGNTRITREEAADYVYEVTPGEYAVLRVTDTGEGMDEDVLTQVFDPFFTTKERGKGTGLGLAMVFGSVKQSGGYIWADSAPGRGSSFTIFLPRITRTHVPEEVPLDDGEVREGAGTVLVVEDEGEVRRLIGRILEEGGYAVLAAASGEEALGLAGEFPGEIDLVLTDVVMPGMDGRAVARALQERRPGTPVMLMSGYDEERAGRSGADEYPFLEKPFSPETLLRRIGDTMDGGGSDVPGGG